MKFKVTRRDLAKLDIFFKQSKAESAKKQLQLDEEAKRPRSLSAFNNQLLASEMILKKRLAFKIQPNQRKKNVYVCNGSVKR